MVHTIVTMLDTVTRLKSYCAELGADPEVFPDDQARQRLPLFLSQIYDPLLATVFGRRLQLFVMKRRDNPTPLEVEKHAQLLSKQFGPDLAFVFPTLPAFERKRLLQRRIPFIVPHRQMFLPGVMVDLRETHGPAAEQDAGSSLSMPAQLLLLYHLQKRVGDAPFALHAWASALGYSRMSISRAHSELVNAGLANSDRPGREVVIQFPGDRRALWDKALPFVRNPVQKEGYYRLKDLPRGGFFNAGLTALAHFTDLAEGPQPCRATWRRNVKAQPTIEALPYRDVDTILIQHWWYPPSILSEDDQNVDRLSLYLSLRGSKDERIQAGLAQLLKGMKW
jgi:hypothetical protein